MNLIYVSPEYQVIEYLGEQGGYELINRSKKVKAYLRGEMAEHFRRNLANIFSLKATEESVDEFLNSFDEIMQHPAVFH